MDRMSIHVDNGRWVRMFRLVSLVTSIAAFLMQRFDSPQARSYVTTRMEDFLSRGMAFEIAANSTFYNYQITDVHGLQSLLPPNMILTPIKIFKHDPAPQHWISINAYHVSSIIDPNEARLEVNLWVRHKNETRCLVYKAYSDQTGFDWDYFFTPPSALTMRVRDHRIETSLGSKLHIRAKQMPESHLELHSDVVKANGGILWKSEHIDYAMFTTQFAFPVLRSATVLTHTNEILKAYRETTPTSIFYYQHDLPMRLTSSPG